MGRIAAAAGDSEEASARLDEALHGFLTLEVPFEVARTRLDLAELAHGRGDTKKAFDHLRQARAAFLTLKLPRHAEQAQALAARLGIPFAA